METLKFDPKVFRIGIESMSGNYSVEILTVDGNWPCDTVYFMVKGDMLSHSDSDQLNDAIENQDWKEMSLEESGYDLSDFHIDKNIFNTAGEGYSEIREEIQKRGN